MGGRTVLDMRALLGFAALALLASGCGGSDNAKAADDPAPIYVESDDCRTAGSEMLEDAQSLLDADDLSEAQRYARFMETADVGYCTTSKNTLVELTTAAENVVTKIETCKMTSKWGLSEGGADGMGCREVVTAFAKLNQLIPEAQQAIDAQP